ncbi:aromatic ring-hydroxylating oxygenase subunit alpha [Pseudonocardia sp. H11422]|uniref:aromatic ring-hydroxylating oxygenase subunit alpha n=1 Tax=Pseudonocardia sp. H11422 TaxID=2835866 RepID=UPI001BDD4BA2|nr:SRPBCC family protein [Pseudonocardia sp. H11422]
MTYVGERADAPEATEAYHRWSRRYPELGTGPISTERFISQEQFDQERDRVFAKSWLNVGSTQDLGEPGAFFVRDIAILGVSLLVVQQDSGDVLAFHNVCSHRGNKLIWESDGTCPGQFACRFHGWGYGRDGALETVPDAENFHFRDKGQLGLVPVRTQVWNGFIFVNLDTTGTESLDDHLAGLGENLRNFPFHELKLSYRFDIRERANWKVALDAQNEIYHIPMLAPLHRFLGTAFASNDDGYTRLQDFEKWGPHTVYCSDVDPDYVPTPAEAAIQAACPDFSVPRLPTRAPFAFHVLFPNMVVAFLGNSMFTYNFWPIGVDETVWEIRFHYPHPRTLAERVAIEQMKSRLRDVLCEDQVGHEALQVGLRSRARPDFVLQDQEIQIRSFHKSLDERISGASHV